MFETKSDARTFIFNHGLFDYIDLDKKEELTDELYNTAIDQTHADAIVEKYC